MKATKERLESHGEPAHPSFLLLMASCAFINGFVAADYDAAFDAINPSVISPLVRATTSRCGKEVQIEVDRIVGSVIQEPIMEIMRLLPMTDLEATCKARLGLMTLLQVDFLPRLRAILPALAVDFDKLVDLLKAALAAKQYVREVVAPVAGNKMQAAAEPPQAAAEHPTTLAAAPHGKTETPKTIGANRVHQVPPSHVAELVSWARSGSCRLSACTLHYPAARAIVSDAESLLGRSLKDKVADASLQTALEEYNECALGLDTADVIPEVATATNTLKQTRQLLVSLMEALSSWSPIRLEEKLDCVAAIAAYACKAGDLATFAALQEVADHIATPMRQVEERIGGSIQAAFAKAVVRSHFCCFVYDDLVVGVLLWHIIASAILH